MPRTGILWEHQERGTRKSNRNTEIKTPAYCDRDSSLWFSFSLWNHTPIPTHEWRASFICIVWFLDHLCGAEQRAPQIHSWNKWQARILKQKQGWNYHPKNKYREKGERDAEREGAGGQTGREGWTFLTRADKTSKRWDDDFGGKGGKGERGALRSCTVCWEK